MEEKTLTVQQPTNQVAVNFFGGVDIFKEGWNMAGILSESDLVPEAFRGKKANCLIALNMSQRMQADPLMVMQNLVVVHGTPTFEAKFAVACFNATGKYTTIKYRMTGEKGTDSWGCVAYAIEKATGEVCEGMEVTIGMAKAEGWYNKNPKWKNIPELMLRYRAASWFIRTTDPGVMMGFQTREEAEDVYDDYEELPAGTEAAVEAEQNANTQQIVIPEDNKEAEAKADDAQPTSEGEAKQEPAPEPAPAAEPAKLKAKPMEAAPMPELFK